MLLSTLTTECQLYVDVKAFAKSIRVVDHITVVCSATLPTAMAVTYAVSLMHVGRSADALEVIHSLGILNDYTPELYSLTFTIASSLCDCHLLDDALEFLHLLLTPVPSSDASSDASSVSPDWHTLELAYRCYRMKGDEVKCIEYLSRALACEDMEEGKKQELALLLSRLYDERGELLKSVEVTSKYLAKKHMQVGACVGGEA